MLCAAATFAISGCAKPNREQTTVTPQSTTPTTTQRGGDTDRTDSLSARDTVSSVETTTSDSKETGRAAYPVDRPRHRESFADDLPPLVRGRETQITQPIRSRAEWERLLSTTNDRAQAVFTDYRFVTQSNFDRELIVFLQSRGPIGTLIRLLWVGRETDEIQFLTERRRVGRGRRPVMQYLFFRVPKTSEQLERIKGRLKTGDRRLELLYHPPPCACRHSRTDS